LLIVCRLPLIGNRPLQPIPDIVSFPPFVKQSRPTVKGGFTGIADAGMFAKLLAFLLKNLYTQ
jgi:hypothetical protein